MKSSTSRLVLESLVRQQNLLYVGARRSIIHDITESLEEIHQGKPRFFAATMEEQDLLALQRIFQETKETDPAAAPAAA